MPNIVVAAWQVEEEREANNLARGLFWDDKLNLTPAFDGIQFLGVTVKEAPDEQTNQEQG
jgi:hypothetical protein